MDDQKENHTESAAPVEDIRMLAGYAEGSKSPSITNASKRVFRWLNAPAPQPVSGADERAAKVCEWKQDTDYETAIWHTSCGEAFVFNDGDPEENFLKFCCYCGGRLTAIRALAGKE